MSSQDRFGPVTNLWTVAEALKSELVAWMPEYVCAYERQNNIPAGTTPAIRSYQVRHAAMFRAEEQTPACVVWIAGVTDHSEDPDGTVEATVQLGVLLVASASTTDATGDVLQRYAAALRSLLFDRQSCGGTAQMMTLRDEDYSRIASDRDRTLVAADLSYEALGVQLAQRTYWTAEDVPRADPRAPWPPAGTVVVSDADVPYDLSLDVNLVDPDERQ